MLVIISACIIVGGKNQKTIGKNFKLPIFNSNIVGTSNIDDSMHGKLFQIIENFNKMNTKEIETSKLSNNHLFYLRIALVRNGLSGTTQTRRSYS